VPGLRESVSHCILQGFIDPAASCGLIERHNPLVHIDGREPQGFTNVVLGNCGYSARIASIGVPSASIRARSRERSLRDLVILPSMTHKVGPKGQVVIPKQLRDALGIEPGDEVTFWRDGDHVAVRSVRSTRPLRGRFASSELVEELHRERAADRAREDRR
jgi:AbrB family looped-hinge helix DNA binding protein